MQYFSVSNRQITSRKSPHTLRNYLLIIYCQGSYQQCNWLFFNSRYTWTLGFSHELQQSLWKDKAKDIQKKKKKSWGEATILNIFLTGERGSLKAKKPTGLILCLKIAQKVAEQVLMTVLNEIIFSLLLYWQAAPCHGVISFNYFYQST